MVLECRVKKFLKNNFDITIKYNKYSCKRSPRHVKLPSKENEFLLRFIGMLHGDGNMFNKRILITEKDKDFCDKISQLFERVFAIALNIFYDKNRNSHYCHVKNSIIFRYLVEVLEVPKQSVRKKIYLPIYMKKLGLKFQKEYVGGLYDAEGWVTSRQAHIGLSITNKNIIDFVSEILTRCGIKHTKSFRDRRENIEYEIHIYGKDNLKKFQEKISFTHPLKITKISSFY